MFRYVFLVLCLGAGILVLVGCGEEPTPPNIPTNVRITQVINSGLGVKIEWDAVAEADGYKVLFEGTEIGDVAVTYFNDDDPGDVGDYTVKAYTDGEESSPSDAVSTEPVTGGSVIYERSAAGNSAFGWAANGTGITASLNDPYDGWDFYADDFQAGTTDLVHIHLVSPSWDLDGTPFSTEDTTWISDSPVNYDTLDVAPTTGYSEMGPFESDPGNPTDGLNAREGYVIDAVVEGNRHYAKVKITAIGPNDNVDFSYAFQTVPGFRRLDTQ